GALAASSAPPPLSRHKPGGPPKRTAARPGRSRPRPYPIPCNDCRTASGELSNPVVRVSVQNKGREDAPVGATLVVALLVYPQYRGWRTGLWVPCPFTPNIGAGE